MEFVANVTYPSIIPISIPTRTLNSSAPAAAAAAAALLFQQIRLPFYRSSRLGSRLQLAVRRAHFGGQQVASVSCVAAPVSAESTEAPSEKPTMGEKDLLVVGAGAVGSLVAQSWLKRNPGCKVVGVTNTTKRHDELRSFGVIPTVKQQGSVQQFPFVIFCAPPYGNDDYSTEARSAAERWNGSGSLLFTSSSAVYDREDNGLCDENTTTFQLGVNSRADKLLKAEEEVLKVGGNVVRLAGLYSLDRGPHTYWLKLGTVESRPDHILNLIHIEDAASLCLAIMESPFRSEIFMGCDGVALSRQELMDFVNRSGKYKEKFQKFTAVDGPLGKKMDNRITCTKLGWKPKYSSFANFLEAS